ncbi:MAG: hypothetical protein D6739_12390, partial [Nitrospirae bacterium]
MRLRWKLPLAFGSILAATALLLSGAAFLQGRAQLLRRIGDDFQQQAQRRAGGLVERLEAARRNARVWSNLELMQLLVDRDPDSQIATFLKQMVAEYPELAAALAVLPDGAVVAASDDRWLGRKAPEALPWVAAAVGEKATGFSSVARDPWGGGGPIVPLVVRVAAGWDDKETLGYLCLHLDWGRLAQLRTNGGRVLMLADEQGRILATSDPEGWPVGTALPERLGPEAERDGVATAADPIVAVATAGPEGGPR